MQDIKKYNRELLTKHRKDQIEFEKMSQFMKVQNLYRIAQEKAKQSYNREV